MMSLYILQCYLFCAAFNVSIKVTYNPPSDFTLPSPPYYRPASSVTFTCVAREAVGPVRYQWTSTQTTSFTHNRSGESISQNVLTANDAGIHTCTATDALGNAGSGSTDMNIIGKYNGTPYRYIII